MSLMIGWIVGLEPTTPRATIWCASQLRHTHHIAINIAKDHSMVVDVPEGIRTPDPRLRRPLLYPAELQAHTNIL